MDKKQVVRGGGPGCEVSEAEDNFVGSDSFTGLAFLYNADDDDDVGYSSPPALGYSILRGPLVDSDGRDNNFDGQVDEPEERLQMTSFISHSHDGTATGWPIDLEDWYGYLDARWPDGTPLTVGGNGHIRGRTPTKWMYSGPPPLYWSEEQPEPGWRAHIGQLGTMIMSSGPFRMEPGDKQDVVLAIIFSHAPNRIVSVWQLKEAPPLLREALPRLMTFDTTLPLGPRPVTYGLGHFPNPASEVVHFIFDLPAEMEVRLVLYDVLGREVRVVEQGLFPPGRFNADLTTEGLPPGVYAYRLVTASYIASSMLTVVR